MAHSGHGSIFVCILTGVCMPYPKRRWIGLTCGVQVPVHP